MKESALAQAQQFTKPRVCARVGLPRPIHHDQQLQRPLKLVKLWNSKEETLPDRIKQHFATTMAPSKSNAPEYAKDEKVLCFHLELLYEAKVLDVKLKDPNDKGDGFVYKIHYKGWKNTYVLTLQLVFGEIHYFLFAPAGTLQHAGDYFEC